MVILEIAKGRAGAASSNTRSLIGGGEGSPASYQTAINYNTFATKGNSAFFGDLTDARSQMTGLSNDTKNMFCRRL